VSDEQQAEQPMRRPRGRHRGLPAAAAPASDGWRARLAAAAAPVVASVEPRIAVAAEWLFERRLHVLIVAASVATIAMIGGAVALISFAGAPQPGDEAATVIESPRPTSTDPASPNTYAPILPSPGPAPTIKPTAPATPSPDDAEAPASDPAEPTTEPVTEEPGGRPDPPGHTNKPDKPKP
jgi:hypothetical protein